MTTRTIVVAPHAVAAYARRRYRGRELQVFEDIGWNLHRLSRAVGAQEADRLLQIYNELEREIRLAVECGIKGGKVMNHKPKSFMLYGHKRQSLPDGQRFIYCEDDPQIGFIVKRHAHGEDVVTTSISRIGPS